MNTIVSHTSRMLKNQSPAAGAMARATRGVLPGRFPNNLMATSLGLLLLTAAGTAMAQTAPPPAAAGDTEISGDALRNAIADAAKSFHDGLDFSSLTQAQDALRQVASAGGDAKQLQAAADKVVAELRKVDKTLDGALIKFAAARGLANDTATNLGIGDQQSAAQKAMRDRLSREEAEQCVDRAADAAKKAQTAGDPEELDYALQDLELAEQARLAEESDLNASGTDTAASQARSSVLATSHELFRRSLMVRRYSRRAKAELLRAERMQRSVAIAASLDEASSLLARLSQVSLNSLSSGSDAAASAELKRRLTKSRVEGAGNGGGLSGMPPLNDTQRGDLAKRYGLTPPKADAVPQTAAAAQ